MRLGRGVMITIIMTREATGLELARASFQSTHRATMPRDHHQDEIGQRGDDHEGRGVMIMRAEG
jgi:hypothetical protein